MGGNRVKTWEAYVNVKVSVFYHTASEAQY